MKMLRQSRAQVENDCEKVLGGILTWHDTVFEICRGPVHNQRFQASTWGVIVAVAAESSPKFLHPE